MVSVGQGFRKGNIGVAGLCSAVSGVSDDRFEGRRAGVLESLTGARGCTSQVALTRDKVVQARGFFHGLRE